MKMDKARSLAVLALAIGCGNGGDGVPEEVAAGGAGGKASSSAGGTGGKSGGDAKGGSQCSGPHATTIVPDVAYASLQVVGDRLVYVDTRAGVAFPLGQSGAIRTRALDGSDELTVYEAPAPQAIMDVVARGGNAYFLMSEDRAHARLYSVPLQGGEPTLISRAADTDYDALLGSVFAADDDFAYVLDVGSTMRVLRVALADGAEHVLAQYDGLVPNNLQRFGDDIWFSPNQGVDGFYRVPVNASDPAEATRVGTEDCLLRFTVTPHGIYCGSPLGLDELDLSGAHRESIINLLDQEKPPSLNPSAPDGEQLYAYPAGALRADGPEQHALRRLDTTTNKVEVVACDLTSVSAFTIGETDVFWIERRDGARNLVRLPK